MGKGHTVRGERVATTLNVKAWAASPMSAEHKSWKSSHGVAVCGESRMHGGNGGDGETDCSRPSRKTIEAPRAVPTQCAVRTAMMILARGQEGNGRKPSGQPTNLAAKANGNKSMSVTRKTSEGVCDEWSPQDLRDMAKAERLQAQFQWLRTGPLMTTPMQGQRRQGIMTWMLVGEWVSHEYLPTAGQ
jgi:hypothetical protein